MVNRLLLQTAKCLLRQPCEKGQDRKHGSVSFVKYLVKREILTRVRDLYMLLVLKIRSLVEVIPYQDAL